MEFLYFILTSRWLPRQLRPCLHSLLPWEDLEVALPTLLARCPQVLLPPPPAVQTTHRLMPVPASTPMVMVGYASLRVNPYLCIYTGTSSHSSVLCPRWLSVWGTVSVSSSGGSVAPVARPAALTEQCRAASSCSGQPARHVSCE